ncbi:DUF3488 and transglutaminase-like domain-containing protein [Microbacterium sp. ARD32]|uniref:transglutaminase family protein n=1 Tax=Microbacterium sp. ARD32 TaxID=2962577 RepID=UPI002881E468|nr:DUF3488 and transglutaminase-like domain-containing protein [Microbacterium sp. ARD32]MDT0158444.1 DUF3488 and transglutaminase-like domain-containing protein [Microbacterium sp. ARD32]
MPERAADTRRPPSPAGAGALTALTAAVAVWAYTGAVLPGLWSFVIGTLIAVIVLTGILARVAFAGVRAGVSRMLVLLLQVVAAALACTATLAGETGIAGLVPTPRTVQLVGLRLQQSLDEIMNGVAPIAASVPIATLLGLAFAVVVILLDQLVAHRRVLLAAVFSSIVGVMPMLISFGSVNLAWFLMQAIVILLLLRYGARHARHAPLRASTTVAMSSGVLAIVAALVLAPVLPVASALPGTGPMLTVDATLRLGDDLRRPEGVEALTLVTSAAKPPYLRMATLSRFDGDVWRPDRGERVPLGDGFGDLDWTDPIKTVESEVSIHVTGVSSDRLPVPYAPQQVTDAGGGWSAMAVNRTVVSRTADAAGSDYTVQAATAVPTLEQIRASTASGADVPELPDDLPSIIEDLAREVTAGADTDYDRLIALQDWFRAEFTYSLQAPVDEGFDGTGADAVATFLEKRTGYCIHFAGAFALMASNLGMPVRIVVGYLPGAATDQKRGDQILYSVSSDQLHSWPEVHFEGIGWVPFEPTATLGEPTDFIAASAGGGSGEGPEAPAPSSSPTPSSSTDTSGITDAPRDPGSAGATPLRRLDPVPVTLTALGILLVLALPLLARSLVRARRLGRARRGDAMAAWAELNDTLVDLGLRAPQAQTARVRADVLATTRAVDADALAPLVRAVEHASYARAVPDAGNLATPLGAVIAQLSESVDGRQRLLARLLPASLFARRR